MTHRRHRAAPSSEGPAQRSGSCGRRTARSGHGFVRRAAQHRPAPPCAAPASAAPHRGTRRPHPARAQPPPSRRPATPRCRYPRPLRSSPLRSPLTSLPHPGPPPPPSRRAAVTMAPPPALPRPPPRGPAPSAARWRAPRDAGAGPRMRKRFWAVLLLPGLRRGVWSGRLAPAIVSRPFAPLLRLRPVALSCTVLLLRSRGSGAGRAVKSGGRGLSVLWCPVRGAEGP